MKVPGGSTGCCESRGHEASFAPPLSSSTLRTTSGSELSLGDAGCEDEHEESVGGEEGDDWEDGGEGGLESGVEVELVVCGGGVATWWLLSR
jgi:hypothetical protein